MKKNKALNRVLFSILNSCFFIISLNSCKDPSLAKEFEFSCNSTTNLQSLDKQVDTRKSFEITIPSFWKKEFYIDNTTSRFYCADTLKELQDTYLLDIAHYNEKLPGASLLKNKAKTAVFKRPEGKIVSEKEFLFKDKKTYYLYSTHAENEIETHRFELYMANKNNSFYRVTVDVFGNSQIEERVCEAMSLVDNCTFHY
ncbi:MAG: hypothetical protein ACPHXR_04580 [Flavicella sp.]